MLQPPVCLRCGRQARNVAWSEATSRFVHLASRRALTPGVAAICGGDVSWDGRPPPALGALTACWPAAGSLTVHLVHLREFANHRNGSWRGDALCGKVHRRSPNWVPAVHVRASDLCRACAQAAPEDAARMVDGP